MNPAALTWQQRSFEELNADALYQILRLRQQVFVLEQNCLYPDIDNVDQSSLHLLAYRASLLVAYLRATPPRQPAGHSQLGRIVIDPQLRGGGLGHDLVSRGIRCNLRTWPARDISIGAQAHLQPFYGSHGFIPVGDIYHESGIPHISMILKSADYVQ